MRPIRLLLATAMVAIPMLTGSLSSVAVLPGDAATPVHGGTVVDGFYEEPTSLLPNIGFYVAFSTMAQETIFSPLLYSDDKGVTHPGLASAIPTTTNGGISVDGLTYTFHLRPNLTWSDGAPLDARDVDYSWRLWTSKDAEVNNTVGFDHIRSASVSADNLSITFHLTSPYAPFVAIWTDQVAPLPVHILGKLSPKQINTSKYLFNPTVSSGPFLIQSRKSGDSIVEVRNPHYYQAGKPYLDRLIFKIIPDQVALANALQTHAVDSAWFLDIAQINTYKKISGYTFVTPVAPNFEQGLLNLKNPILQDVRVRQALEYGLNRQAMVQAVWHGTAVLIASDQVPTAFSYDPSVKPYPYDPKKASSLLDAAGWKLGSDGFRHRNGKTLTLVWSTTTHNTWRAQDEIIVQQNYRSIGIDLRIFNYDSSALFGQILPQGKFDIVEWENGLVADPDITIASYFASTQLPPHGSNWGHYINPAYDKLIAAEESTTDLSRRKAILGQMQRVMNTDLPSLWLYDPPAPAEYSNALHNYSPAPYSFETWNTWEWWKS